MATQFTTALYATDETIDRLPLRVLLELLIWKIPLVCVHEDWLPFDKAYLIEPPLWTLTPNGYVNAVGAVIPLPELKWPDYDKDKYLWRTRRW